jgi:predicted transcriptional regulator
MKQATNFRLDEATLNTINLLANDLHKTKTHVVEEAVMHYAASLKNKRNALLQFAGCLTEADGDAMLDNLQRDKDSKDFNLSL